MKSLLAILFLIASTLPGQDQQQHTVIMPGKVAVEWHFIDEHRVWLSVNSFSKGDWAKDGYNPSFTYLRCQYKPQVKKMADGQWQITFVSEIAEDIP
jgi:hypothetical protein